MVDGARIHFETGGMRGCLILALLSGCGFRLPSAGTGSDPATDAPPGADMPVVDMPPPAAAPPFAMTGARWLMPCTGATSNPALCDCSGSPISSTLQIGG